MAILHVRNFLGCLPLRAGIWVLSLTGLMLGAAGAAGGWFEVQNIEKHPVVVQDEIALFAQAIVFSLYGLFSLIGLIGGLVKNRIICHIYARLLAILFGLTILSFGYTLYYTFRPTSDGEVLSCTRGDPDQFIVQFCDKGWSLVKGVPLVAFVTSLVIQCYTYIITGNFLEERELDEASRVSKSFRFPEGELGSQTYLVGMARREKLNV